MVSIEKFKEMALALENVSEQPHFENLSYKHKNKIFATLNSQANRACVKLNAIDQSAFCSYHQEHIYPVPNKWGKHGWTNINLLLVEEEMLEDALNTAYETLKGGQTKKS